MNITTIHTTEQSISLDEADICEAIRQYVAYNTSDNVWMNASVQLYEYTFPTVMGDIEDRIETRAKVKVTAKIEVDNKI